MNKVIIVCGPTASGKTDLAHKLAKTQNGEIINGDSIQIYQGINMLSASPEISYFNELPYHLYNFLTIGQNFSVAKYLQLATEKINEITLRQMLPIIVGGTGMYINALVKGFSIIPETQQLYRNQAQNLFEEMGSERFYQHLTTLDPLSIRLHPNDSQRVIRACEVYLQTGYSLFHYNNEVNIQPLKGFTFEIYYLLPDREFLYKMCDSRLSQMFKIGVIEEVETLTRDKPNLQCKAIGFNEIASYLEGKLSIDEALNQAQIKTRNYAKRQITWFNNQLENKIIINFHNYSSYEDVTNKFIIN